MSYLVAGAVCGRGRNPTLGHQQHIVSFPSLTNIIAMHWPPDILSVTENSGVKMDAQPMKRGPGRPKTGTAQDGAARQAAYERPEAGPSNHDGDCARLAGAEGQRGTSIVGQTNAGGDAGQPDPDRQF
jgi:hypothetical protein